MADNQLERLIQDYLTTHLLYVEDGYEYDYDTSFIGDGLIWEARLMDLSEPQVARVYYDFHSEAPLNGVPCDGPLNLVREQTESGPAQLEMMNLARARSAERDRR